MALMTTHFERLAVILALTAAASMACGGGGDGDDRAGTDTTSGPGSTTAPEMTTTDTGEQSEPADDELPAPADGFATLGGQVTLDGVPVVDENITLYLPTDEDDEEADTAAKVTTDADGWYVIEGVTPGPYVLGAGVLVEGLEFETGGGLGIDVDRPCAADGFTVLNALMVDSDTDETIGWLASASTEEGELELDSGDRLRLDVAFVCGGGTQAP